VPRSWAADRKRCHAAGIPEDTGFATKPELAKSMIKRVLAAGLPFGWFTADEGYGDNGPLRRWLEEAGIAYVVAVSCDHHVPIGAGKAIRADKLAAKIPARGWQRVSCGPGSKGDRLYDWALAGAGPAHYLLIRRSVASGELAFYRCWAPAGTTLAELVKVAGSRWAVEECFRAAKNEAALGHYQARSTPPGTGTSPWPCAPAPGSRSRPPATRRTASPAAAGPVTAIPRERGQLCGPARGNHDHTAASGEGPLIGLTVNEIRRMHAIVCRPAHPAAHHLHWSRWRRRHQARARHCHYQRRRSRCG
jgi:DDE superfamily endonuclease